MARICSKSCDKQTWKWLYLTLAVIGELCVLAGCASDPGRAANGFYPPRRGDYPKSVAVLPFTDLTDTQGIAETIRVEFYGHMSTLPFDDVELHVIDEALRDHGLSSPKALLRTSVKKLGRILDCDAVVLGNVYEFQRIFAGLYSSMNVGISVQLWDTRTAEIVWSDQYTARIHEGGLPISFIDLPMITLRSGLNLRDTIKLHAIDEACRYLVHRIPTPGTVVPKASGVFTLQIGAFSSKERAMSVKGRFKSDGFPVFVRRSNDDRGVWHRVLLGPYQSLEIALEVQRNLRENYRTDSLLSRNRS